ncbi:PadR family transcriptional regulator [Pantoea sp. BAV 3049]|uniref:PadR family transcriptional regulator n=1 Tax=Pantoea sp. BAV 3049 TaxID=2654188 RepID=UPI0018EEE3C1|nr:PadR family transcriptional regulator [Pantoea sp. BAV 3049]
MFNSMFRDSRGGRHRKHDHSEDGRSECFNEAESREEALEMMFAQWRRAMREERIRHDGHREGHRHHHRGERGADCHEGRQEDYHPRYADRRGDRRDGHRGHGRGRGGDDAGHRDRPSFLRGRKFGADELQLLLLSLLKDQASYGYELIKILKEKSGGFYTPSPGVIYPALTYLEDVGYVSVLQEGNRKRYAISEQGQAYLAENQQMTDALLAKLALFARQSESFNQAMFEQRQPFSPALTEAIHALRSELHHYHGSSEEVQAQVADIIQQTLAHLRSVK